MAQIRTVKFGNPWKESRVLTREVDPKNIAKEIDQMIKRLGFYPLANDEVLKFAQKIIDNHNQMTEQVVLVMKLDLDPAPD